MLHPQATISNIHVAKGIKPFGYMKLKFISLLPHSGLTTFLNSPKNYKVICLPALHIVVSYKCNSSFQIIVMPSDVPWLEVGTSLLNCIVTTKSLLALHSND